MFRSLCLMMCLWSSGTALATPPAPIPKDAYIEFLWTRTSVGALARQETRSFALDGRFDHQICVAILNKDLVVERMEVRAVGPAGRQISRQMYRDVDGSKKCFSADLPADAPAGKWTYEVRVNDQDRVVGAQSVDVFATVEALVEHTPAGMPYVLGRPNYDPSLAPDQFKGELVWVMHIKRDGTVSAVDIERAEGVGVTLQPKAVAAGLISLFPPDPAWDATATFRRHLSFRPDN